MLFNCSLFAQIEFYSGNTFKLPLKESKDNYEFKSSTDGIKFSIKNLTSICVASKDEFYDIQQYRYGIKYLVRLPIIKAEFLAGSLTYSQGISRLKKPSFTIPSALTLASILSPGIAPSLPSWTSAKTNNSVAVSLSPSSKKSCLPSIQLAYNEDEEIYASIYKRFSLPFVPSSSISFSGGVFDMERKNSTSWFQSKRYFSQEKRYAFESELNLLFSHFRFSCASGIHESPFGGVNNWIRLQNSILAKDFVLHSFFYSADPNLITVNSSEPRTKYQLCINPQYTFYFNKNSLRLGALSAVTEKLLSDDETKAYCEYSNKVALSFLCKKCKFETNCTINKSTQEDYFESTTKCKLSVYLKKATLSSSYSYKNESETKNTHTWTTYIYPKNIILKSASNSIVIEEKDGEIKIKPSLATTFRGGKKIKWNIKTEFELY